MKKYDVYRYGDDDSPLMLLGFTSDVSEEQMIERMRDTMGDAARNDKGQWITDQEVYKQWTYVGEIDKYCMITGQSYCQRCFFSK